MAILMYVFNIHRDIPINVPIYLKISKWDIYTGNSYLDIFLILSDYEHPPCESEQMAELQFVVFMTPPHRYCVFIDTIHSDRNVICRLPEQYSMVQCRHGHQQWNYVII